MKGGLLAGAAGLLLACPAFGQVPVVTAPAPATTAAGNSSGTIAGAGAYVKLFSSRSTAPGAASRRGCTIINTPANTHNLLVTEGLGVAASTDAKAVVLVPGQAYYCAWQGTVLEGEIDIKGTDGDTYYAAEY